MKKAISLFTLIILVTASFAQQLLPADITESINKRIEYGYAPSIVVGIIDKDGPHYYSFGTKTIGGAPVNEHTIYEIGSVSKTFTATLLAEMVIAGQMKTDDPAQNYLPASVKLPTRAGKQITLGELSDHTSGLPRLPNNLTSKDPGNPYADYTVEQMYSFLNGFNLTRDIGSAFEYSNLAAGLLGHILSLKAGMPYEALLLNNIARSLGMKETKITFDKKMKRNLAMGYSAGAAVANWDLPTLAGAGAIRSSVFDMLKYVAANIGIQRSSLYPAMQLAHQPRHNKSGGETSVGLAWLTRKSSTGDIILHNGATGGYRAFCGFIKETGKGVVVLTNSDKDVDDIGIHLLNPASPLMVVKRSVVAEIKMAIGTGGPVAAEKTYGDLKKNKALYDFDERAINSFGYTYLHSGKTAEAVAVFKINVEEFPNSDNAYDSYAEALMKDGQKDSAIANYKKSLALNPLNSNATDMLVKMGVASPTKDITVEENILATYVGKYELAPNFIITVTHEGTRLFAQATGQERFELFAKSNTDFYLKVVPARVVFSSENGKVNSLTLFQGGKEIPGKKIHQE